MKRFYVALMSLALSACAAKETVVPALHTQVVEKPVLKSCLPDSLEPAPDYPDTKESLLGAPSAAERYRLLFAGRMLRSQRLAELETIVKGCK